jgi:hypothetical protein
VQYPVLRGEASVCTLGTCTRCISTIRRVIRCSAKRVQQDNMSLDYSTAVLLYIKKFLSISSVEEGRMDSNKKMLLVGAAAIAGYYYYTRVYNRPPPPQPQSPPPPPPKAAPEPQKQPKTATIKNAAAPPSAGEKYYGALGVDLETQGLKAKNMTSGPFFGPMARGSV